MPRNRSGPPGGTATAVGTVAAVISFSVLVPVLSAPLFWDDHLLLFFARRLPLAWIVGNGLLGVYFRPLGEAGFWMLAHTAGTTPLAVHTATALLAAFTAGAVAFLVARETGDRTAGLATGLLVAASPITVSSAAWLANLFGLLAVALGLAALLAAPRKPFLAAALGLAAGLAKEDGFLWLLAALLLAGGLPKARRRLLPATALALAGTAAALAWRRAALGGTGGVVPPDRILHAVPGGAAGATALFLVFVAILAAIRSPLPRAAMAVTLSGLALGLVLMAVAPTDRHGLWLRFFLPASVGGALLWGVALARTRNRIRRVLTAATAAGCLLLAWQTLGWESRWRKATAASDTLVRATIRSLRERSGLRGAVAVSGPGDEIALSAAVARGAPDLLERVVPLRPDRLNIFVCPVALWPDVRPWLRLAPLPGNPQRAGDWIAGAAFAPVGLNPGLPVVRPLEDPP